MSASPFARGDKVVAYLRDSGHEKQELSVQQQEAAIRAYCLTNHLVLTLIFKDEAKRGSTIVGREQLQALMNHFRHMPEEVGCIIWKYNRFARNVDNAQFYRAELRSRGYIFYSLNDTIPDGPEGRIFEALIDYKDEQFLLDLSLDVKRGLHDLVAVYGCVPGVPPTGFMREKVIIGERRDGSQHVAARWVPDPLIAPRVRQAFELRAAGKSLGEINKVTNLFKSINSYRTFWPNKLYVGTLIFGDQVIENYCEPMVPQDIFDQVQARQNNFSRGKHMKADQLDHPRRVASTYLLSGLAFCARCGGPLYGSTSQQRNGSIMRSYFCSKAYRTRDCVRHRIPIDTFESTVVDVMRNTWLTPERLSIAFEKIRRQHNAQVKINLAERDQLKKELGETRRQLTNISDTIANLGGSRTLERRLADLESQETDQLTKIAGLDAKGLRPIAPYTDAQIREQIAELDAIIAGEDIQLKRRFLQGFINRVDVDRVGNKLFGNIIFYYPPDGDKGPASDRPPPVGKTVRTSRRPSGPPMVKLWRLVLAEMLRHKIYSEQSYRKVQKFCKKLLLRPQKQFRFNVL